ncbi:MAG: flagellar filament capping protein FliD [Alphaproteobacteria bacterium]
MLTEPTDVNTLKSKISFNGDTIWRTSNEIDDLLYGVTIRLMFTSAEGGETIAKIDHNKPGIHAEIQNFITAYNDLRDGVNLHKKRTLEGEVNSEAILFGESIIRKLSTLLDNIALTTVKGVDADDYSILPNIGLELDKQIIEELGTTPGKFTTDTVKLEEAVYFNFQKVKNFLANLARLLIVNLVYILFLLILIIVI